MRNGPGMQEEVRSSCVLRVRLPRTAWVDCLLSQRPPVDPMDENGYSPGFVELGT